MSNEVKLKVNVPMFEIGELEMFDNHIHDIVEEYSKMLFKEKDQILTQRIIMKQEEEIEDLQDQLQQKENIIKEVRDKKEELMYLASKCSIIYRNNIEVVAIYDRLKELFEILDKVDKGE